MDTLDKPGHDELKGRGRGQLLSPFPLSPRKTFPSAGDCRREARDRRGRHQISNRTDVLLALFDPGTAVAGVFTKSKCPSAPVEWCRAKLKGGKARALVVNSGNANAFTGKTGRQALRSSPRSSPPAPSAASPPRSSSPRPA